MPNIVLPIEGFLEQTAVERTAGTSLSGHRVVVAGDDGLLVYADAGTLAHMQRALRLTTGAVTASAVGRVVTFGQVVEPSWAWTPGLPIYLGVNGVLTQVVPTFANAVFLRQVASAVSATEIHFDPQPPLRLT